MPLPPLFPLIYTRDQRAMLRKKRDAHNMREA